MATKEAVLALMQDDEFNGLPQLVAMGAEAVPVLVAILRDPAAEPLMRQRAAVALGEIGAPAAAAAPALADALAHADPVQRILAVRALAKVAGAGATASLAPLLHDPDASVAKVAVQCLGAVGGAQAVAALAGVAESGPHDFVREQARDAVRKIEERLA
ncbi:MAG TPA: HEAT repeat domain-containing protein [Longimicrobiaceae bacterium]|jgi:HEAT repeat protein|nr:HEAT repeat domain-containing protein [Longimicrobiaceae bacterium]